MQNILFFPVNAEEQFLRVSKNLSKVDPSINSFYLLLVDTDIQGYEEYLTFDKLVENSEVVTDKEIYEFELEHSFSFNDLILKDKLFRDKNKENQRILYFKYLKSLALFIQENSIDTIVCSCISDGITYGTFKLAKSLNIPFLYPMVARVSEHLYLADSLLSGPVKLKKEGPSKSEIEKIVDDTFQNRIQPSYANFSYLMIKKGIRLSHLITLFKLISLKFNRKSKNLAISDGVMESIKNFFKRKFSFKELKKVIAYSDIKDLKDTKFIYWPLHFHPEAGTIILGRWFHNQYEILKSLSRVIPSDVKILVKEHRGSTGRRPLGFYNEIASLPGVEFVDHSIDTFDLILQSKGVAVITGTAGLEALALNQNVMTFGDVHYNQISSVIKAIDLSNLRNSVKLLIEGNGHDREEVISFFSDVLKDTQIVNNFEGPNISAECIEGFTNLLLSYKKHC
tara:strand:+ start:15856 stop:17214 length:1359 start_codon:yes stop_codon:yes gene_type:complete